MQLSHTAFLNIECLKIYSKHSPIYLDKHIFFNREIELKNNFKLSLGHLFILESDAVKFLVKKSSLINFKFVEGRPRDDKDLKSKANFVDFRMKLVVLPCSELNYEKQNALK